MAMLDGIKTIQDLSLTGRRVFIRVDLNVPLSEEGGEVKVSDDTRIREALLQCTEILCFDLRPYIL